MSHAIRISFILPLITCGVAFAVFQPPNKQEREKAVGSLAKLDPKLQRTFTDAGEFQAKSTPGTFGWLAQHEEPGQTYDQYFDSHPNIPDVVRSKLYIQPIGTFDKAISPDLNLLRDYTAAYYQPLEVVLLPAAEDKDVPATERINTMSEKKQWKTGDIMQWMRKRLPRDCYAMLAVTMTDLYPDEGWNFVFGEASTRHRVGVFSFARYHPAWFGGKGNEGTQKLVLRRAAKVLTHEMGHMFGIEHCIHYECNMNGANSLEEADFTPMELCPVCLRKLHYAIRFDPVARYEKLQRFDAANELETESKWIKARIEAIRAAK
ncbi:archaemetzincin [Haloferula sp. BvORR071]|uniref:archaemetzincin n=1 Tax=Haloferula sp. BvORR071 TaxID=1396141 RepID=UPI000698375A|nr:archaemetzincin [Haloferula sp. BvORR071]